MYINRSLSYLEQVVVALGKQKPGAAGHTPYRQSKLTHLLKDSLGGNCKTLLIANIYGEASFLEETVATLQFAARVRAVQNQARVVEFQDPAILLKKYEREIVRCLPPSFLPLPPPPASPPQPPSTPPPPPAPPPLHSHLHLRPLPGRPQARALDAQLARLALARLVRALLGAAALRAPREPRVLPQPRRR
jgi:hypothetical protein